VIKLDLRLCIAALYKVGTERFNAVHINKPWKVVWMCRADCGQNASRCSRYQTWVDWVGLHKRSNWVAWLRSFLEKLMVVELVNMFPTVMESDVSSAFSEELPTELHPEPDQLLSLRFALIYPSIYVKSHNSVFFIFYDRNIVRVSYPTGLVEHTKAKYKSRNVGCS
jgi:hypothetical protein